MAVVTFRPTTLLPRAAGSRLIWGLVHVIARSSSQIGRPRMADAGGTGETGERQAWWLMWGWACLRRVARLLQVSSWRSAFLLEFVLSDR